MMKSLLSAAAAVACLAAPAIAAQQQPQQRTLVVTANEPTVSHWVDRVSQQISARLRPPALVQPTALDDGSAVVTFRCDEAGRPTAVMLVRRSRYPVLNQIALSTIRHMPSLGPLPEIFATGQRFRANIIFAQTQAAYDEQVATLRREAATARVAAAKAPAGTEIALSAGIVALSTTAD
jgi:TonB family protein